MRGRLRLTSMALACFVAAGSVAHAQGLASIAGVVKDSSGAVLPGVTVEASSPALIEKARTAVTDGTGQYQIVSLTPGTYTVTFTLAGFSTVRREGIELAGSFAATVNADMRVGQVSETVTVSGESPIVDVQNSSVQKTITKDVIDAIPTPRLGVSLAALTPGIVVFNGNGPGGAGQGQRSSLVDQDVGGQNGDVFTDLSIHGSRPADMKTMWNGLSVATQIRFGESTSSAPSMTAFQEVSIDTAGADATTQAGGVRLNYTPRDGGNTFRGVSFVSYAGQNMRGSNYTDELKAKGMASPGDLKKVYDVNPGFGGPLKKDKLWFFVTAHWVNAMNFLPGSFPNLNAGRKDALQWIYAPDTSKEQQTNQQYLREETLRFAWQANQRNKFGFYWADKYRCSCLHPLAPGATSPEALPDTFIFYPFSDQWAEWTSPVTNRLLLEAGIFRHQETWGTVPAPTNLVDPTSVGVFELAPPPGQVINTYHGYGGFFGPNPAFMNHNPNIRSRFAVSYITGAHAFKGGFDQSWAERWNYTFSNLPYGYTFLFGRPFQVSLRSDTWPTPLIQRNNIKADGGAFVQDKWTRGRLTLQGGIRVDWFSAYLPEQSVGPSVLTPSRNLTFPEFTTLSWKDVTPKIGMAYDLTGDGKTALKVSIGKYVLGQAGFGGNGLSTNGPAQGIVSTTSRFWNDADNNFFPDCDLRNPAPNGECGPWLNPAFGSAVPVQAVDDDVRYGWGKRQYQWEFQVSAQREVSRGVSVYGGYFRRWYGNFYVTDNRAVSATDYQQYSLTAPANRLLPGGGGYPLTGLFMISQAGFARIPDNFTTFAQNYGTQIDHWNGFDLGLNVRAAHGLILQGGLSTGHQLLDNCAVAAKVPESLFQSVDFFGTLNWQPLNTCRVEYPWLTQVKFLAGYTIPKADVQIGATLQSIPGYERLAALWQAPNALISSVIGRPVPGDPAGTGTTAVNIIQPGTIYSDRLNQLDLRFGKVLRFARTRSIVSADIFNVFNSSIVTSESRNLTNWQQPLSLIGARLLKVSWQFDF